jgi:hypothetical protein
MSLEDPVLRATWSRRRLMRGAIASAVSAVGLSARNAKASGTAAYPDAIKLVAVCRKLPYLTDEQFYNYWTYKHGPYATIQVTALGAFRYVQSHTQYTTLTDEIRASRGETGVAFQGVTEVWFPSAQVLIDRTATVDGALANANLARDEHNFIDTVNSSYYLAYEHVLLGADLS